MTILSTTNYPNFLLENTFGNQYFKDVVNPAKTGTGAKPPLGQLIKNWNPLKAFSPTMMKTGPTGPGLIGAGITAGMIGGQIGDWAYKNWEPATKFGNWAGGGIYDYIHGPQMKFRRHQLMNKKKQDMQQRIRQAEAKQTQAAAQASANAAAAGQRREGRGGTHMSRSRDQGGLGISQSQAQSISDANRAAGMSGWGLAHGGRASYFDGGLLSLWPR